MRVASRTFYRNTNQNISTITEQLKNINEQIASSRRINRPSDDPVGITHALNIREVLSQIEQYGTNIKFGKSWLQMTDSALQQVQELTIRARTIANQMSTGTYSASDRRNAAQEIQNMFDQIVQIGNTKIAGRYIFGGDKDRTQAYGMGLTVHSAEAASTNNPAYTGTAISSGTYTGLYTKDYVVEITTGGAVGDAKYKVSEDGGVTWGDAFTTTTSTTGSGVYEGATTSVTVGTWGGASTPSASGNEYEGITDAQYAFRVTTGGTVPTDNLTVTWTETTSGRVGLIPIPIGYTPGDALDVENDLTVSFSAGGLVVDDTFTVDVTPSDSLESPPNQGAKITFEAGTLTVGDRFTIEASQYGGDQDRIDINIGQSAQIVLNLPGDTVFGEAGDTENNLFDILAGLQHALEENDQGGVQASLEKLSAIQVIHLSNMADVGSRLNRLEASQNILSDLDGNNQTRLSGIEDLDLAKALSDLNAKQMVFQATLYSSAQVTKLTLMDYL